MFELFCFTQTFKSKDDFQLGIIDTWPAHSANQRPSNVHISLNRKNQLLVTNDLALGKPEITPKPKFLENLEKFLHRELKLLDCYNSQPSEARLQVRLLSDLKFKLRSEETFLNFFVY